MIRAFIVAHYWEVVLAAGMFAAVGALMLCHGAKLALRAARKLRSAALGDELLKACAGDLETAKKAVQNVKIENEVLVTAARNFLTTDFKRRQAEFYDACANYEGRARRPQVH